MRTLAMPAAVHETTDLESSLEILDQCCKILSDYRKAGCPSFPEETLFVNRMKAIGVTTFEAVELLARVAMNYDEENV